METTRLFCYIPTTTHRKTKAISALNGIDIKDFVKIAHRVSGLADKEDYGITLLYKKSIELLSKYK